MGHRFAFLDHPGPLAFAHRGGAAGALENSMMAFQRAVELGYRYLETDAHATADGVLVAFHDRTLDRVTNRTGRIAQLPYREVRAARIGGVEPIPLLEDLITAWPDIRVNIDVKDYPAIAPLAEVLRRTQAYDRVCVTSFSQRRLVQARAAVGRPICTSLGPQQVVALRLASYTHGYGPLLARLARAGIPCVQVPPAVGRLRLITGRFVTTAHALGMQVHAWTIDDRDAMHRLLDLGVDGIMSDDLTTLRAVLIERAAWHPRTGTVAA